MSASKRLSVSAAALSCLLATAWPLGDDRAARAASPGDDVLSAALAGPLAEVGCARCHPAPYFTDHKMHNVGVLSDNEPDGRYDTPSLIEAYRTGPFLHDGRALSIEGVLTTHNATDHHGKTADLTPQQIDDIVTYILSL